MGCVRSLHTYDTWHQSLKLAITTDLQRDLSEKEENLLMQQIQRVQVLLFSVYMFLRDLLFSLHIAFFFSYLLFWKKDADQMRLEKPKGVLSNVMENYFSAAQVLSSSFHALIFSLFNIHVILAQVETITNHSCQQGDLTNILQGKHKHVFANVAGNHSSFATNKNVITTNKSGFFSLFDWILPIIGKNSKPNTRVPASRIAFQHCELPSSGSIFGILKEARTRF